MLEEAAERSRAIDRIVGAVDDEILCILGQIDGELFICKSLVQVCQHQINDVNNVVLGQGLIEYNLVQTVEKFRTERTLE